MVQVDTISPIVLVVHSTHHKEAHLHSGSDIYSLHPSLFSLTPPLPLRDYCLKPAFDFWRSSSKQTISFFNSFFYLLTIKEGKCNSGKAKANVPSFPLDTWKAKSERQSSEYLCVYTHSSFKANICPNSDKHKCLAADSQDRILAYFVSSIAPVWK